MMNFDVDFAFVSTCKIEYATAPYIDPQTLAGNSNSGVKDQILPTSRERALPLANHEDPSPKHCAPLQYIFPEQSISG